MRRAFTERRRTALRVASPRVRRSTKSPQVETQVNNHAALWLDRSGAEWMAAGSWTELKVDHTQVFRRFV